MSVAQLDARFLPRSTIWNKPRNLLCFVCSIVDVLGRTPNIFLIWHPLLIRGHNGRVCPVGSRPVNGGGLLDGAWTERDYRRIVQCDESDQCGAGTPTCTASTPGQGAVTPCPSSSAYPEVLRFFCQIKEHFMHFEKHNSLALYLILINHSFELHLEEDQVRGLELVPVAGEDTRGDGALLPQELSSEMWAVRQIFILNMRLCCQTVASLVTFLPWPRPSPRGRSRPGWS